MHVKNVKNSGGASTNPAEDVYLYWLAVVAAAKIKKNS